MLAKNLKNAIIKRGGEATIAERDRMPGSFELSGTLEGYDVHMFLRNGGTPESGGNSYFTIRAIALRGYYDPWADYNSGRWTFCNRIKDLDWSTC